MRSQTKNQGAGDTRDQIIEMIDRMIANAAAETPGMIDGRALKAKIKGMPKAAAERPGGLGRK